VRTTAAISSGYLIRKAHYTWENVAAKSFFVTKPDTQSRSKERHVLVRCVVENRSGTSSLRFVEQSHYRLWQYMMANKHDLSVKSASLALWLSDDEFDDNEAVFSRSGTVELVDRIAFAVYDRDTGIVSTLQRFVARDECVALRDSLMARFPEALRSSEDFAMEQENGRVVIREGLANNVRVGYHFPD
jgi:hypothetical protein